MYYKELSINKKEKLKIEIYNLREQGLTYEGIVKELKKQEITMSLNLVRKICKEMYGLNEKTEPKAKRYDQSINEEIYILREEGLTYTTISRKLQEQGIKISNSTVGKICKEIYSHKRKKEVNTIEKRKEKIYNLRKQGWSYEKISEEVRISKLTVITICKAMYNLNGEEIPKLNKKKNGRISDKSKKINEAIHEFREQGLAYQEISDKLKEKGTIITRQGIEQRYKRFLKLNEQQLAKAILNLTVTRKATIGQIQQIADYYGVDLEKTMNSLEER